MQILAELDGITVARAAREHLPVIERLLADDPTSPDHVATTTLISDDVLGPTPQDSDLEKAFDAIDTDPRQFLTVVLDGDEHVIGTLQLSLVPTLARGGGIRAVVTGARIRSGSDSIAVGKRLFAWVIKFARENGARVLLVVTDKDRAHMHGFFTTMGFSTSHDGLTLSLCGS